MSRNQTFKTVHLCDFEAMIKMAVENGWTFEAYTSEVGIYEISYTGGF